jgi:4-amino-4-deoxy-L-arabinose transferase-like glycosyltransferase
MRSKIVGIILLAIVLRFWQLGAIPEGFHADETAFGYNAYSLLKTGRDEYGVRFPLVMKSFSDYKAAIYSYITIPFVAAFGLNEWAVRAPSAIFGVLFVLITYVLVYSLSQRYSLALLSMMLAALSPVGIFLSRVQSDPLMCVVFFYVALYMWFEWLKKRQVWQMLFVIIFITLSFYTNTITRIFAIPFMALVGWYSASRLHRSVRPMAIGVAVFVVVMVAFLFKTTAGERFAQVSVFGKANVQLLLEEELREDGIRAQPVILARVMHNKVTAFSRYLFKNYSDYLSIDFLFLQAKQPIREQVPNMGIMLLVELPFLLVGIYSVIRRRLSYGIFSILWVMLVPMIMSIASDETPNIHRFFLAMLPLHLLTAQGIMHLYEKVMIRFKKLFVLLVISLFTLNVGYYLHQLFVHQPAHAPIFRNDEYTRLAHVMKEVSDSYDIIVSQKILEHILFYWPVEPDVYQKEGSPRDTDNATYRKFFFVTESCPSRLENPKVRALMGKKILYVDEAECKIDPNDMLVRTIKFGNNLDAYYLVEKMIPAN